MSRRGENAERNEQNVGVNAQLGRSQIITAAGLLGVIALSNLAKTYIPMPIILASIISYGVGAAVAVSLYRVAALLKDGTPKTNVFGEGALAGAAIAFALITISSVPIIVSEAYIKDLAFQAAGTGIAVAVGFVAGFLQSRGTFVVGELLN